MRVSIAALLVLTACRDIREQIHNQPNTLPEVGHTTNLTLPARGAFYYPWYPETWTVGGTHVSEKPLAGYYRSDDIGVIDRHIRALDYAKVDVAIASWWGQNTHHEAARLPKLLKRTRALRSPLKWALYYEKEGVGDPGLLELQADLRYIKRHYLGPTYAVVEGKPVLFVYNTDDVNCEVARRWQEVATSWYIVLKVFAGYKGCAAQPDAWHQYGPAEAADRQPGYAYSISPGFWRADEPSPRLPRNLRRWRQNILAMIAAGDPWQLITSFNEWGEGTAVEEAESWTTDGYGSYLDALAEIGSANPTFYLPISPRP